MGFEYATKKVMRSNRIVREVDGARQRQLWRSAGIGLFLVVVLLFWAWQHFELLRHGYQIERMQQERAAEEEINRHLRLEVETLRAPRRIEKIATEQLHLVAPARGQAIVIERVTPAPPPEKSIVAAREHHMASTREGLRALLGRVRTGQRAPDARENGAATWRATKRAPLLLS